jgi:hypothetical protein
VPGGRDARCAVDGEADVPAVLERRLSGIDADPNANLAFLGPLVRGEGALRLDGGLDRLPRTREDVEEGIALSVDLVTTVGSEHLAQHSLVFRKRLAVALAKLTLQPRRSFDISEEEGDRAARGLVHARSKSYAAACLRQIQEAFTDFAYRWRKRPATPQS